VSQVGLPLPHVAVPLAMSVRVRVAIHKGALALSLPELKISFICVLCVEEETEITFDHTSSKK